MTPYIITLTSSPRGRGTALAEGLGRPKGICPCRVPARNSAHCQSTFSPTCLNSQGVGSMAQCSACLSTLGLRMDDNTIRVATGLRLGTPLCPTPASTVGRKWTYNLATHGPSFRWSEGRHHRHAEMNDTMERAFTSAKVPSRLETSGLH